MAPFTNIFCAFCSINGNPCTSNANCAGGGDTCQTNSNGAFKRLNATSIIETGSAPNTCVATGAHPVTMVNVSCVPRTTSNTANNVGGLPGPAAVSVPATVEIIP
jgi:hypothetical protein